MSLRFSLRYTLENVLAFYFLIWGKGMKENRRRRTDKRKSGGKRNGHISVFQGRKGLCFCNCEIEMRCLHLCFYKGDLMEIIKGIQI